MNTFLTRIMLVAGLALATTTFVGCGSGEDTMPTKDAMEGDAKAAMEDGKAAMEDGKAAMGDAMEDGKKAMGDAMEDGKKAMDDAKGVMDDMKKDAH